MINEEVRKILKKKLNLSNSGLYLAINRKKEQLGYTYSIETAAYVLAVENKIDISKYDISSEEMIEIREAMKSMTPSVSQVSNKKSKVRTEKQIILNLESDFKISCPCLPESVIKDAIKMRRIYPYIYLFENSIRFFVKNTLDAKYGANWWATKVSNPIQKEVEERQQKDGRNRWHGKRGEHPIFYTNIDHLARIITNNMDDFKDKLPDVKRPIEWLTNRIDEVELSRNIVAHNNPLSDGDIARVKMYFKEWIKQISL